MIITEKNNYISVNIDEKMFSDFIAEFENNFTKIDNHNIIIEINNKFNLNKEEILLFLPYAEQQQQNGMTFVIVISDIEIDEFPENFNIVPTLQEAEDVLEMEEIQRDLGF